jgi:hypothetical protein
MAMYLATPQIQTYTTIQLIGHWKSDVCFTIYPKTSQTILSTCVTSDGQEFFYIFLI